MGVLWDPKYKGKILAYDNGEHNFSFTALTDGHRRSVPPLRRAARGGQGQADRRCKKNVLSFYTTADEALQLYKNNDVALIWANYGQQQVKMMKDAGARIAYVNPKEGALAWLDTWALTSGVQDKELAEKWVNFVLQKKIGDAAVAAHRLRQHGGRVRRAPVQNDKLVWLEFVEDSDQARRSLERDQGGASRRRQPRAHGRAAARPGAAIWLAGGGARLAWPCVLIVLPALPRLHPAPLRLFLARLLRGQGTRSSISPASPTTRDSSPRPCFLPVFLRTCLLAA